jgi:hypothetical protein
MSRYTLPGSNRIIYVLNSGESEIDCDIRELELILDKTEEQIHITRAALAIIKENIHDYIENPS